ncbi:MAG: GtrA family protein [Proteobacteria bacterium]|nr:GtrA family protein [Pseudomonadota bacterium]
MRQSPGDAWRGNRKLRFLVVGASNTAFGYLVFLLIYGILGDSLHYLFVAAISHFLAVTVSFITQRRWVFVSSAPWLAQYWRFNLANLATLSLNLVLLWLLVEAGGLNVLISQMIGTIVSVCASYLLHKHFSFRVN